MDTSTPAVFVGGNLLRRYVGRRVRMVVEATRVDVAAIAGQSINGEHLMVRGAPSSFQLSHFVEATGVIEEVSPVHESYSGIFNYGFKHSDILGYGQLWGICSRFSSPLGMILVVALIGFGLFDRGFPVVLHSRNTRVLLQPQSHFYRSWTDQQFI